MKIQLKKYLYYTSIKSVLGKDPLEGLFYRCFTFQYSEHWKRWGFVPGNYYEFGTGEGTSMKAYVRTLKWFLSDEKNHEALRLSNIFAFDSFVGLPDPSSRNDINPAWRKGQFACDQQYIENMIFHQLKFKGRFRTVAGFYEQSLTSDLRKELSVNPPSIVNVDVDLYSSAKTVLEWIRPILQDGTIFHFDDIWDYLGNQKKGEIAAIDEFNRSGEGKLVPFFKHGIPTLFGKTFIYNSNRV